MVKHWNLFLIIDMYSKVIPDIIYISIYIYIRCLNLKYKTYDCIIKYFEY